MSKEPKQHHYVPSCYSKNFANEEGCIFLTDLWDGCRYFPNLPDNALKIGYMYSQPVHSEQRFDNSIEVGFSKSIENDWGPIVERLAAKTPINQTDWGNMLQFAAVQHTRVPNCFDAIISLLRKKVLNASEHIDYPALPNGIVELYQKYTGDKNSIPKNFSDLYEAGITELNIDEHACIISMPYLVQNIPIFGQSK